MKHAVLGVGAIGGLLGTALGSLGEDVTVIVRQERLHDYPAQLVLETPAGSITAHVKPIAKLTEPVDVLWIATKTYQLQAALENVVTTPTHVIPLLNGIDHVAALRARFGDDTVAPATIAVEAEKAAAGRFIQRSPKVRLNLLASTEPFLRGIAEGLNRIGFVTSFIANEQTLLWGKLCFLGPFALVTSASGKNLGEVLADPVWKQKLNSAVAEACAVAKASGAQVDAQKLRAVIESSPPTMRSSMQKDVAAGRPLELDAIGGPIVRGGEEFGVDVSTTAGLMAAIRSRCK